MSRCFENWGGLSAIPQGDRENTIQLLFSRVNHYAPMLKMLAGRNSTGVFLWPFSYQELMRLDTADQTALTYEPGAASMALYFPFVGILRAGTFLDVSLAANHSAQYGHHEPSCWSAFARNPSAEAG